MFRNKQENPPYIVNSAKSYLIIDDDLVLILPYLRQEERGAYTTFHYGVWNYSFNL